MEDSKEMDRFERTLEDGLVKVCRSAGMMEELLDSPDIDDKWDEFIKDYVADAVVNFNEFPEAAIGFAGFLGMAVANRWDRDWEAHKADKYQNYYGSRGFDDMDDHIVEDILRLKPEYGKKVSDLIGSCTEATLGLIRHEGIEAQTAQGFYILVRCYGVLYRIGASLELKRLGYKKTALPAIQSTL